LVCSVRFLKHRQIYDFGYFLGTDAYRYTVCFSSFAALLGGENDLLESLNIVVNDHEVCVALVNIQGSLSLREDIIELHYQYHITTLCSFFSL
jgi:hypothetical protein